MNVFSQISESVINAFSSVVAACLEQIRTVCGDATKETVERKIEVKVNSTGFSNILFKAVFETADTTPVVVATSAVMQGQNPNVATAQIPALFKGVLGTVDQDATSAFKATIDRLTNDLHQKESELSAHEARFAKASAAHSEIERILRTSGYTATKKVHTLISHLEVLPEGIGNAVALATDSSVGFIKRYLRSKAVPTAISKALEDLKKEERDAISDQEKSKSEIAAAQTALKNANQNFDGVWQERCKINLSAITSRELAPLSGWHRIAKSNELIQLLEGLRDGVSRLCDSRQHMVAAVNGSYYTRTQKSFSERLTSWSLLDSQLHQAEETRSQALREIEDIARQIRSVASPEAAKTLTDKRSKLDEEVSKCNVAVEKTCKSLVYKCGALASCIEEQAIANALLALKTDLEHMLQAYDTVSEILYGARMDSLNKWRKLMFAAISEVLAELDNHIVSLVRGEVNRGTSKLVTTTCTEMQKNLPAAYDMAALRSFLQNGGQAVVLGLAYGASWYCTKDRYNGGGGGGTPMYTYLPGWLGSISSFQSNVECEFKGRIPWQLFVKHVMDRGVHFDFQECWFGIPGERAEERVLWFPCPDDAMNSNLIEALERYTKLSEKRFSNKYECDVYNGHIRAFARPSGKEDLGRW